MTLQQALFWNLTAASPNMIGAVIGLFAGNNLHFVSFVEAFCSGMFLYISLVVMLPEIIEKTVEVSQGNTKLYVSNLVSSLFGISRLDSLC
ncbi:hypothetical protein MXB_1906 [Myxobolus squamalis]|nr:hypothetical protein MXB_1906 [Myxobolus squamalis]